MTEIQERLEQLRANLRAGNISYSELADLQDLVGFIPDDDLELLEAAGVAEGRERRWICQSNGEMLYVDTDGRGRHANGNPCDYAGRIIVGQCVDCGVDTQGDAEDPAVSGCYANRGFGHMRVVGR